jgi:hypothetical protein
MPSAALSPAPKLQFFDTAGNPLTGGKVYTYAAGTTTPLATYADAGGVTTNTNPIILDVRGEAGIWLDSAAYKFVLKSAADTLIWTVDNITSTDGVKAYVIGLLTAYEADVANTTDAAKGDALVGFRQSNAAGVLANAVGRTVHQKLQEMISVFDFGAKGDGATDDTTSIQNAINSVQAAKGGTLYFPPGTYNISAPLTVTGSNVMLMGAGGDSFHDGGTNAYPATKIVYTGTTNTNSIVTFKTINNVANSKIQGGGVQNMWLACEGTMAGGITILSANGGTYKNVVVTSPTFTAYNITSWANGTIAEAADSQDNLFMQCQFRTIDLASTANANGFVFTSTGPGTAFANASFNTLINCLGQVKNGNGYYLEDADNNALFGCRVIITGTGKSLFIRGADTNYFYGFSGAGIVVQGTAEGAWATPIGNCFLFPDEGNATTYPTLGTGVRIYWQGQYGVLVKGRANQMIVADSNANANAALANQGVFSLVVSNDSGASVKITNAANQYWGMALTNFYGTNDLRFTPGQAGSYFYMLADAGFQGNTYFPGAGTTASGANAYLNNASTPSNLLLRSTSSVKYKTQIEDIKPEYVDNLSKLRPVWYRSLAVADNKNWSWYGLVAEEVAKVEPRLVIWSYANDCYTEETMIDAEGVEQVKRTLKPDATLSPDGVQYDRITALLVAKVQQLETRLAELEKKA